MRLLTLVLSALTIGAACAQELTLPAEVGSVLPLAPEDHVIPMGETEELTFTAPAGLGERQVVLAFRARINNPTTVGSTNALIIQVNGRRVELSTARRELRLLNKPNSFAWTNPPELTWYLTTGQWRIAYAPDFEILLDREHYGPRAYEWVLDISDLVRPGANTITLQNTGTQAVADHAGAPLDLVFRDLRLEVRAGPGVQGGGNSQAEDLGPWEPRERRSAPITIDDDRPGAMTLTIRGHRYELTSEFSAPGAPGETQWLTFERTTGPTTAPAIVGPGWRLERTIAERLDDGRLLMSDHFTNTGDEPVGIRIRHRLRLLDGRADRVNFGGLEDPARVVDADLASAPYLFLPRDDSGVALVATDDLLRQHARFEFDEANQTAGLTDDWFGLHPGDSYTIVWAVYATDTGSVFDIINLLRQDWLPEPFIIEGGINFFEPDAILAYDDEELRRHLEELNINITMSQGGWVDRQLMMAGTPNIGHGPIVTTDLYADYRDRLRRAIEKLRRLRPGIKCLIYYDPKLVAGENLLERYSDAIVRNRDGSPRSYQAETQYGAELALVLPTLNNSLGQEILEKIPTMILDEIGADGLYWDEMRYGFNGWPDYAHPDGNTFEIDKQTGEIIAECGAPEIAWLDFKIALLKAFESRGALVVGNTPPGTLTEFSYPTPRFCENMIPHHGLSTILKTALFTPISYAGYSVYHDPAVREADFLEDIARKVRDANLYLFSAPMFYHLFTGPNLATYEYPITPIELDAGLIIGRERIITLRPGSFGWPGEAWLGEVVYFGADMRPAGREPAAPDARGLVTIDLPDGGAAVIVRQ
ncbi:MAG: hypothetical protein AB7Y46_00655 [Armatimonadota bacterium]